MNCMPLRQLQNLFHEQLTWMRMPSYPILGVAVDSRKVRPRDVFFALPGEKTDGHHFIKDAVERGASAVIVQRMPDEVLDLKVGVACVDDSIRLLQQVASLFLRSFSPTILALTGSLGKTTTREYTKALLSASGSAVSPEDNCNSQIGLALSCINSLMKVQASPRWFVAEMGMTEKGNISKLISFFPPDVALVTCVSPVHFHNFGSIDDVARAKSEIFQSPQCKTSIVNLDSACSDVLLKEARGRICTVSMKQKASYSLRVDEDCLEFFHEGKTTKFKKPTLCARHLFENLLHAMALATEGGADIEAFGSVLHHMPVVPRRLEFIEKKGILFINDSYNAAVASMVAALDVLHESNKERKVAVLGQMKELGPLSQCSHETVGKTAAEKCDILYCLGEECGPLVEAFSSSGKPFFWAKDLPELVSLLVNNVQRGDVVLLKGSNSNRLWTILDHFA